MMPNVEEMERRIDAKLKELKEGRDKQKAARDVVEGAEERVDTVSERLRDIQKVIERKREIRRDLLDGFRFGEPDDPNAELWTPERVERRREALADELDESIGLKGRLLDRLDVLGERSDAAKEALKRWIEETKEDRKRLEHLRKKRKKILDKQGQIGEFWYITEFDCNDGTPVPKKSHKALEHWAEKIGDPTRRKFGTGHVNSGHRHAAYNNSIGGASLSIHVYDGGYQKEPYAIAADCTFAGASPYSVYAFMAGLSATGGCGKYGSFTHSDNRERIGWARSRWDGP
jgi:hypothetical protein